MMTKSLLLEIGLEEVPARFVRAAVQQLENKVVEWLKDTRIVHGRVEAYATPRRLAVLVEQVAHTQTNRLQKIKGPSYKIGVDYNGDWTQAALGFAGSHGVTPEQFVLEYVGDTQYVYVLKNEQGAATSTLIGDGLKSIICSMTFPKLMRWGEQPFKFIRPIRWIVALLGSEIIPFSLAGVVSNNVSYGHRFLGEKVVISEADQYVERLRDQHVIVDIEQRRHLIMTQIQHLEAAHSWKIQVEQHLLEEVLFLVENPTTLFGKFDRSFLNIPAQVLMTSMREHQRYFPVVDHSGQLLPYFVTVRNGDDKNIDVIARGNEKVLRARLADAQFFYKEDQKLKIEDAIVKLDNIAFHEQLGMIGDKVRRICCIATILSMKLGLCSDQVQAIDRAAHLCKFDLVTHMVHEFPELQGVMGEDYARKKGELPEVCQAIKEHYLPKHKGDSLPETLAGCIVSLADKIDTITGCFSISISVTGSHDPYGLRRQATAIVNILAEKKLGFMLSDLLHAAIKVHEDTREMAIKSSEVYDSIGSFFSLRVQKMLLDHNVTYDIANAVIAAGCDDVVCMVQRAHVLMKASQSEKNFKNIVHAFHRVGQLAAQAQYDEIQSDLFVENAERELYKIYKSIVDSYKLALQDHETEKAFNMIVQWEKPITQFFQSVMVMTEEKHIRENRLALLLLLDKQLKRFSHFEKILV